MKKLLLLILMIGFTTLLFAQKSTTSGNFDEPFKICFNNNTSNIVYVAVRYKTTSGYWTTKYWFKYGSYEKDQNTNGFTVKTYNRYFYYYARTKENYNGSYTYWGSGDNYQMVDGKQVGMREVYINKTNAPKPRGQRFYVNLNP